MKCNLCGVKDKYTLPSGRLISYCIDCKRIKDREAKKRAYDKSKGRHNADPVTALKTIIIDIKKDNAEMRHALYRALQGDNSYIAQYLTKKGKKNVGSS